MVELKNKKTGRIVDVLSDEDYAKMLRDAEKVKQGFMNKFIVTKLSTRNVIQAIKPKEIIKPTKKKNEG